MDHTELEALVEGAYEDRTRLSSDPRTKEAVLETIEQLDRGTLRVCTPPKADATEWTVHAWVKKAILLYFGLRSIDVMKAGDLEFFDKIPVKTDLASYGVRIVPPGIVRYGAFLEPGAIVMPGYVNIGAYVGAGSMVDTWATVGSCAQIGK
ncbi:MAG: 2,3,4,5-tetrahydropyridine-2,6-dicarboxylate N-succinyltransferase, partial [Proteobacteria bacterium]